MIRIAALAAGVNRWVERVEASAVGLDSDVFPNIITVSLEADKRFGKVAVAVASQGDGSFLCDRCGEPFNRNLGGRFEVMFVERNEPLPDEMPGDDLRTYRPGDESLDVSTEVRDALVLAIPMKLLCRDDCRGLCPRCGANLNLEPCRCPVRGSNDE